jgi:hypothetical protein
LKIIRHAAVVVAALALTSCSDPLSVIIESDTTWAGSIGNASYDGSGNGNVDFTGSGLVCWAVQKNTERGRLRVYARRRGLFGPNNFGDATTVAAFGVVSGCSE